MDSKLTRMVSKTRSNSFPLRSCVPHLPRLTLSAALHPHHPTCHCESVELTCGSWWHPKARPCFGTPSTPAGPDHLIGSCQSTNNPLTRVYSATYDEPPEGRPRKNSQDVYDESPERRSRKSSQDRRSSIDLLRRMDSKVNRLTSDHRTLAPERSEAGRPRYASVEFFAAAWSTASHAQAASYRATVLLWGSAVDVG
jgi:hypothetical protein